MGVGIAQQREVADDEQNANFRGTEDALRKLEAGERIGGKKALAGEDEKGNEHGDGRLPMEKTGEAEAAHESDGTEDIRHVIDVEAVARALVAAHTGQGSVEAVAEPVEREAEDDQKQSEAVEARECVEEAGGDLRDEAEESELVGGEPARGARGHPEQGALLQGSGQRVVDAAS